MPRIIPASARILRAGLLVACGVFAAALPAQSTSAPSSPPARFAGVEFPSEAAGFIASRAERYPDAALGMTVQYRPQGTRAIATLYVYPKNGPTEVEFNRSLKDIVDYYAKSGNGITTTTDSTGDVSIGSRSGHVAILTITFRNGPERSLLYVFEKDDSFVKLRVSMDPALRLTIADRIDTLLATILDVVTSSPR